MEKVKTMTLNSNSPGIDKETRQQLKNLETDEQLKILAKHIDALETNQIQLNERIRLCEQDRHVHLPETKEETKSNKLSDFLKKIGL